MRTEPPTIVAHILPFPSIGGTEQATLRVMKAVEPHGYSPLAILLEPTKILGEFFEAAGRRTIAWPAPQPSLRHGPAFLRASRKLANELQRLGVGLIHCADVLAAWHVSLAGRLARIPVICHVRNRHDSVSRRDRIFLAPVSHWAFVSQDSWNRFGYRVPRSKGTVIYDGLDVLPSDREQSERDRAAIRSEFEISREEIVIGMLARVTPQKDYDTLVAAAKRVVDVNPAVRFMICGDHSSTPESREHFAYVRGRIEQEGLSRKFVFTGFRNDVRRLLQAFDVSVLSTHQEGLPLVLLEAMAESKPLVATAVDGVPELVSDGVNGFLVAHGDAEALAARVLELMKNPELRARLGEAGRSTVLKKFTAKQFSESLAWMYARFAKSAR